MSDSNAGHQAHQGRPGERSRLGSGQEVNCDQEVDRILALDKERRDIIFATEQMKAEQNKVSKTIPQLKKAGEDTAPVFQRMGS